MYKHAGDMEEDFEKLAMNAKVRKISIKKANRLHKSEVTSDQTN